MPPANPPTSDLPPVSPALWRWFTWYARRYLRRHFQAVRIARPGVPRIDPETPLLIYLNHPSWWDPLTCLAVASGPMSDRHHRAPIDAQALGKYRFFEKLGFFGVERDSAAGSRKFLRIGGATLVRPGGTLWVPAQGHFTDPRIRPITIRPGAAHLARQLARADRPALILPLALEYPFWDERLPQALMRFGDLIHPAHHRDLTVEHWQALLEERLTQTADALADDALVRDPARFELCVAGKTGVNPVYDAFRSIRARLSGQTFHKAHTQHP